MSANVSTSGCMNESILRVPPVVKTTTTSGRAGRFYSPVKHACEWMMALLMLIVSTDYRVAGVGGEAHFAGVGVLQAGTRR